MKGDISVNDKVFLVESKNLTELSTNSYQNVENNLLNIDCKLIIKENKPVEISAKIASSNFNNISCDITTEIVPEKAKNAPISKEKIIEQFNKTKNTIFKFNDLNIELDDNVFLTISSVNELRRIILDELETKIEESIKRNSDRNIDKLINEVKALINKEEVITNKNLQVSVLLNILNTNFDYSKLKNINRLYIPLKYFVLPKFKDIVLSLSKMFNLYIYMPTIMKNNYTNLLNLNINNIMNSYDIKGVMISNLGQLKWFENFDLNIIGNYTLNIFNNVSVDYLKKFNINQFVLSPELDKDTLISLTDSNKDAELIVYGNAPVMNSNYCVLGKSNKCYNECSRYCNQLNKKFYLKDRLNFKFRVIPDNIDTISTIYNCKTTSIKWDEFNVQNLRIDILDENIDDINSIISKTLNNERFEGKDFTNANLNKEI